jgi:LysR family transcriptional regulator, benzoate and cis,cis-muconate-responsive activator of ben and cat genes
VSQQIKAVETALGVELFERTHRGVELTAAGEAFVQEARRALNAADRVGQRAQAAARGEVGTLRLAYTLATVHETLPAFDRCTGGQASRAEGGAQGGLR